MLFLSSSKALIFPPVSWLLISAPVLLRIAVFALEKSPLMANDCPPATRGVWPPTYTVTVPSGCCRAVKFTSCESCSRVEFNCASTPASTPPEGLTRFCPLISATTPASRLMLSTVLRAF